MPQTDPPPQELIEELALAGLTFAEVEALYGEDVAIEVSYTEDLNAGLRFPSDEVAGPYKLMTTEELYQMYPELAPQPAPHRTRGPQKAPKKEAIHIRLDADVVAFFRGLGPGWQTKLNHILRNVVFPEDDGSDRE